MDPDYSLQKVSNYKGYRSTLRGAEQKKVTEGIKLQGYRSTLLDAEQKKVSPLEFDTNLQTLILKRELRI